jgi:CRISPR-associated protein Cmr6
LKGQGAASKLLDGTAEFRPNVFRAALRGHALRIFGGLTEATIAEQLVETLFGGIRKDDGKVGLLSMMFRSLATDIKEFGSGSYRVPTYQVEGELNWFVTQTLPVVEQEVLKELTKSLLQFAMVFGGFGKAWRRADHRLFFEEYYDNPNPLIGCHWQWLKGSLLRDVRVRKLEDVGAFIDKVRQAAAAWMQTQGTIPNDAQIADWREAWHPETVQVWGRSADEADDCEAIRWLHGAYRLALPQAHIREGLICRTSVTGQVNKHVSQIGRLWHRMYPVVGQKPHPDDPKKRVPTKTRHYLELLTFFPDDSPASTEFLRYLTSEQKAFQKLW